MPMLLPPTTLPPGAREIPLSVPGKREAAAHTGLAFAVALEEADEDDDVVDAAAVAVEATAALSAASASDAAAPAPAGAESGVAPKGKNHFFFFVVVVPDVAPRRGWSQSSRFVATSRKNDIEKERKKKE